MRGLQVWPVAESLCLAGPSLFINNPREAEIALATIRNATELLPKLLAGKKMVTAPGLESQGAGYLAQVEERYVSDAYNSLSIEGYRVTDELIERVARGDWNPDGELEHGSLNAITMTGTQRCSDRP